MSAEIIFDILFNPITATTIASVALVVSLYVFQKQHIDIGGVKKVSTRKTIRKKTKRNMFPTFSMPHELRLVKREMIILVVLLCLGAAFFLLKIYAPDLQVKKNIGIGMEYMQHLVKTYPHTQYAAVESSVFVQNNDVVETVVTEESAEEKNIVTAVTQEDVVIKTELLSEKKAAEFLLPIVTPEPPVEEIISPEPELVVQENPEADGPAPDVAVSSFSYYGSTLTVGGMLSFSVIVSNNGEKNIDVPFNTQLLIDEDNDGKFNIFLALQQTRALLIDEKDTKIWRGALILRAGTHKAKICADEGNAILEMNEKNNCAELVFTVAGKEVGGDFVIENLTMVPQTPTVGQNVAFFANVSNKAPFQSKSSYAQLTIDEKPFGVFRISGIPAGKYEKIETGTIWKTTAGAHSYSICADSKNEVLEIYEDNNCSIGTFFVPEAE